MTDKQQLPHSFYITTAIHYANAGPHLGHAYEAVLGDIVARYWRQQGVDTFFLSGTDEHGDKILRAAAKADKGPQAFVDANSKQFVDLYRDLNLSNDDFIRTSDKHKHWPGVRAMWEAIEAKGDIYKDTYEGLYCVGCEAFLTEKELVDGKCPSHQTEPELVREDNYFFKLSRYVEEVRHAIKTDQYEILPHGRKNEILALLDDGVVDVSFSRPERDIPWGIPVPGDPGQNIYVWCDALTNYVSALGYGSTDDATFRSFWPANAHIVGKDIARFHAIIWPAMLLSAGLPLPQKLWIHGFITSGGVKMSKSIGNVIDPKEYLNEYGVDAFRYYLGREISPFEDGDFTKERFEETYNANLANGLGNLLSRTIKMATQYFDGTVSRGLSEDLPLPVKRDGMTGEHKVTGYTIRYVIANELFPAYHEHMRNFQLQGAADVIWELIGLLDGYIATYEPYKLIKTDTEKTENCIYNVLVGIDAVREMIGPFMPHTAEAIHEVITHEGKGGTDMAFSVQPLEAPLFARI